MAKSIKIRAKEKGGVVTVKALMNHPMETGLRKDKKTGEKIPAHFIQEVKASSGGADVMTAPPSVIKSMAAHPLTDKGLAAFLKDTVDILGPMNIPLYGVRQTFDFKPLTRQVV